MAKKSSSKKSIMPLILGVGGAILAYNIFGKNNDLPVSESIKIIKAADPQINTTILASFGAGYLSQWAKAVKIGNTTFTYNGSTYNAFGGTKIK